jgi:hypothetical protein
MPISCRSIILVALVAFVTAASAHDIPKLPAAKLMSYILDHLDVRTFPSSIGPRRETNKVTFSDYGFMPQESSGDKAVLTNLQKDWFFTVKVLEQGRNSILICVGDEAADGGTYHATYPLRLVVVDDGQHLRGKEALAQRSDCQKVPNS